MKASVINAGAAVKYGVNAVTCLFSRMGGPVGDRTRVSRDALLGPGQGRWSCQIDYVKFTSSPILLTIGEVHFGTVDGDVSRIVVICCTTNTWRAARGSLICRQCRAGLTQTGYGTCAVDPDDLPTVIRSIAFPTIQKTVCAPKTQIVDLQAVYRICDVIERKCA